MPMLEEKSKIRYKNRQTGDDHDDIDRDFGFAFIKELGCFLTAEQADQNERCSEQCAAEDDRCKQAKTCVHDQPRHIFKGKNRAPKGNQGNNNFNNQFANNNPFF